MIYGKTLLHLAGEIVVNLHAAKNPVHQDICHSSLLMLLITQV